MEAIIIYELKVAISIAIFYTFYRLLLSKETLHRLNRIVLIATAVLSFILPFCVITIHKTVELPLMVNNTSVAANASETVNQPVTEWWWPALAALFAIGTIICLAKVAISVLSVWRLIKSGELVYKPDGSQVIVVDRNIAPCSWMNWIILSREDYLDDNREILEHEKAHIEFGHSKDILVVDILTAFQWFNPMMWMLRADLRAIHEFEADDTVLKQGVNIKEYLNLLIKKAISESGYSVTNSFNHSILKNRITMMSKSKTQRAKGLRVLYIIPLVCVSLAVYAEEKIDYTLQGNGKDNENVLKQDDTTAKKALKITGKEGVKITLKQEGKPNGLIIMGSSSAVDNATLSIYDSSMGDLTKISFATLKDIAPEEIESITVFKGEEALNRYGKEAVNGAAVIKMKDGTEKISFLDKSEDDNKIVITGTVNAKAKTASADNAMYIVDGKLVKDIKDIKPEQIKSMSVLKDDTAKEYMEKYNYKEPVSGVIIIELKK